MRKNYKLALAAIFTFILTIIFFVLYFGVIKFGERKSCEGVCRWALEAPIYEEKILIENNAFSLQEIKVKKGTGLAIFVENRDKRSHFIEQDYRLGEDFVGKVSFTVDPGKKISLIGLFNPPADMNWGPPVLHVIEDKNAYIRTPYSDEYRIICISCTPGARSIKVVLEK